MSKLLITGGAGFIGSNFIHYWTEHHPEDQITNLDLLTYAGNLASLKDIENNHNYTFVKGDICDEKVVDDLVTDADLIVHFAAESHNDRAVLFPGIFVETNVRGTFVLLEAARRHNKRFHHISTDEVFGHLPLGEGTFTENTPYAPRSAYSASKAASDHLVRAYNITFGLPVTITNCSNNFGPYQHPEKFIPRMITNLIDGDTIKIYGDGKYVRDWLHVLDHCRAIEMVLDKGKTGETYLVGGMTKDVNNLEVAKLLIRHIVNPPGKGGEGGVDSHIEYVKDRPGHDRRYAVDWSKINKDLGWEPQYSFEDWLKNTVEWYQNNEAWWRPLKKEAEKMYAKQ